MLRVSKVSLCHCPSCARSVMAPEFPASRCQLGTFTSPVQLHLQDQHYLPLPVIAVQVGVGGSFFLVPRVACVICWLSAELGSARNSLRTCRTEKHKCGNLPGGCSLRKSWRILGVPWETLGCTVTLTPPPPTLSQQRIGDYPHQCFTMLPMLLGKSFYESYCS